MMEGFARIIFFLGLVFIPQFNHGKFIQKELVD